MNLKDIVDRHPLRVIVGMIFATAAAVAGTMNYFCSQRIFAMEYKVQESENQLASIHRGLGDNKYLDVRSFVHQKDLQAEVQLPLGSQFFNEENFYAESDPSRWVHEKISGRSLFERLNGEHLPPYLAKIDDQNSVHLWRDSHFRSVEGGPSFMNLGSFIMLEKIPIQELLGLVGQVTKGRMNNEQVTLSEIFVTTQSLTNAEVAHAKKTAKDLHARALKGEDFAELARRFSAGETAMEGGELGAFERGELSKEIEDVVFKMKAGQVSDVIRTRKGCEILKLMYRSGGNLVPPNVPEHDESDRVLARLDAEFRGDAAGTFLLSELNLLHTLGSDPPNVSFEIVQLQKVGNVVYAQVLRTWRDVTVRGLHYPNYFVRQEIVIVTDQSNLYHIETFVPTSDPAVRGEIYSRITEWFSKLAIFVG